MYIDRIKLLQIDLISSCNAGCPSCFRQDRAGRQHEHFPQNKHLELDILSLVLSDSYFSDLKEILLCGNYGDPMASSRIVEVFDLIKRIKPDVAVFMHTNGSLGNHETWVELGRRLSGSGSFIKFAIDGLEDTNHLYRRRVSWNRVMKNARTFIESGGRAVWKFVIFEHNKHQIEQARRLANEMGFVRFETTPNYSPEQEPYLSEEEAFRLFAFKREDPPPHRFDDDELNQVTINCDSQKEEIIFLDFEGHLWPCCWIAGLKYSSNPFLRMKHETYFAHKGAGNPDFNSLKKHSVQEVLSHPWFAGGLTASWKPPLSNDALGTHPLCIEKCGKCLS